MLFSVINARTLKIVLFTTDITDDPPVAIIIFTQPSCLVVLTPPNVFIIDFTMFTSTRFTATGLLIYLTAWSINFSDDSNSPDFANFFPLDHFCLSPDPRFSLRSPINVSFMETLLSETSRMGDGSLERGSWRFRGKIPVVRNPDSRLRFIDPNYKLTSRFKRDGKNCLLKLPFVLTSLFHSCRIFLHDFFIDEKTQTSSGCNKCVAFGGSIAKYTSFCSAILITSRLKWEAKLSPKAHISQVFLPQFSYFNKPLLKTSRVKPVRFCDIVNAVF